MKRRTVFIMIILLEERERLKKTEIERGKMYFKFILLRETVKQLIKK